MGPWQWEAASRNQDVPSPPFNTTLGGTILVRFLSRLCDWLLRRKRPAPPFSTTLAFSLLLWLVYVISCVLSLCCSACQVCTCKSTVNHCPFRGK